MKKTLDLFKFQLFVVRSQLFGTPTFRKNKLPLLCIFKTHLDEKKKIPVTRRQLLRPLSDVFFPAEPTHRYVSALRRAFKIPLTRFSDVKNPFNMHMKADVGLLCSAAACCWLHLI